jgi:diketogulonate reductase-like aldo/keto reductase
LSVLSCPRSSLYVTTKTPDWAWTKEEIFDEVEKSLKRLQVTYLDLVLLHTPAPRKGAAFLKKALTEEQIDRLPDPMDAKGEDMKKNSVITNNSLLAAMEAARLSAWQGLEECVEKGLVR